jgi:hypothetical protein
MCPVTRFAIGLPVCLQRQKQDRREPERGLCEREGCPHWVAPHPRPVKPRHSQEAKVTEDKPVLAHRYGNLPLPEGGRVMPGGRVRVKTNYRKPCPKCGKVWINEVTRACRNCTRRPGPEHMARMRQIRAAMTSPEPVQLIGVLEHGGADASADLVPAAIEEECAALAEMLLAKNRAYGNSALNPVRVFSRADPEEQIRVRLDDKLSRLMRGQTAGEDTELDLLGYLVLLRVHRRLSREEKT